MIGVSASESQHVAHGGRWPHGGALLRRCWQDGYADCNRHQPRPCRGRRCCRCLRHPTHNAPPEEHNGADGGAVHLHLQFFDGSYLQRCHSDDARRAAGACCQPQPARERRHPSPGDGIQAAPQHAGAAPSVLSMFRLLSHTFFLWHMEVSIIRCVLPYKYRKMLGILF